MSVADDSAEQSDPRTGFRLVTPLRVRFAEADMQGIVFNANYLAFADVGITEYFRALMAEQPGGGEAPDMLGGFIAYFGGDNWVRHAEVDFRGSARADDLVDIAVRIDRFGRTSYGALCHIIRGRELLTVIRLTYVWFDPATQSVCPVSPKFIDAVTAFERTPPVRS